MIAGALLGLALLGEHHPASWGGQTSARIRAGGWTVQVTSDRFTGQIRCAVHKGRVEFKTDVLIFHLGHTVDTSDAVFRIDAGPAQNVHVATYEDERRGYYRDGGPLENPSNGEVALPSFYVADANWVFIRPTPRGRIEAFDVRGVASALQLARSASCPNVGP